MPWPVRSLCSGCDSSAQTPDRSAAAMPQPASCAEHGSQCICLAVFPTEAALWVAEAIIYGLSFA